MSFTWDQRMFQEMEHDFFPGISGENARLAAMDLASTVIVCAFPERMGEAAVPIFSRYPRLEVGPPPPPSGKG